LTKKPLDDYDKMILKELIINPRLSDNKISQMTKIPVKTVNRKRKILEKKGIIKYLIALDNGPDGTDDFAATVMYIIKFKYGVYRKQFLDAYKNVPLSEKETKHISFKWLGERDGHLLFILILESRKYSDFLEIYNVEIVSKINKFLGPDLIEDTTAIPLTTMLSYFHNYDPLINMPKETIKEHWPRSLIFVSDI